MHPHPIELSKTDDRHLIIRWSDDVQQRLSFRSLRKGCRCAGCMDKREKALTNPEPAGGLPILSAAEAQPLDIVKMSPVGNYAYNIQFSDGHSAGIFTFEMLRGFDSVA